MEASSLDGDSAPRSRQDDLMIRRIESGGMEAGSLDGDSAACSLEAGWGWQL